MLTLRKMQKLLEYLNEGTKIPKPELRFTLRTLPKHDGFEDVVKFVGDADENKLTWNVENPNRVVVVCWCESRHNGDPYDDRGQVFDIGDKAREQISNLVIERATEQAREDERKSEKEKFETAVRVRVENAMNFGAEERE